MHQPVQCSTSSRSRSKKTSAQTSADMQESASSSAEAESSTTKTEHEAKRTKANKARHDDAKKSNDGPLLVELLDTLRHALVRSDSGTASSSKVAHSPTRQQGSSTAHS